MTQASSPPSPCVDSGTRLDHILKRCTDGQDLESAWRRTEQAERLTIIETLLNLVPVLEVCKFDENPFISNHDGDVIDDLQVQWSYDDYSDLERVFRPFLALAFNKKQEFNQKQATLSLETLRVRVSRFKIGPRKHPI